MPNNKITPSKREKEIFDGFSIISADIIRKDRIALGLKKDYDLSLEEEKHIEEYGNLDDFRSLGEDELATRVAQYNSKAFHDQDNLGGRQWAGGVRRTYPVFINDQGKVITCNVQGDSTAAISELPKEADWLNGESIDYEIPFTHHTVFCAANIDERIFLSGSPRKLFMRTGKSNWLDLTDEKRYPNLQTDLKEAEEKHGSIMKVPYGFHAFDGFSEQNIYAGGRGGDCWHFNGECWRQIGLPSYFNITSIVCAADNTIFIAGKNGGLIKGTLTDKEEQWEIIDNDVFDTFNEMTWFKDTLYLSTDSALYSLKNSKLEKYDFLKSDVRQTSFFGVKSCDDALLSYGPSQALVFDGTQWTPIIG